MSLFKSRLPRFNTINYQQVSPIPCMPAFMLSVPIPIPIYSLPLPFNPVQQLVAEPAIVDFPLLTYPTATPPPVGSTLINPTGSLPAGGYLVCNGDEVSRTIYSALFNIIGTYYGDGDYSTTFNIPNLSNSYNPNIQYIIKY
jgi:hypothetical protein